MVIFVKLISFHKLSFKVIMTLIDRAKKKKIHISTNSCKNNRVGIRR